MGADGMSSVYQVWWPGNSAGVYWGGAQNRDAVVEATGLRVSRAGWSPADAAAAGCLDFVLPQDREALIAAVVALKLTVT